ncbi:MAG: hypothetical protein P1U46_01585 [Patescibacteria group bacterium]|nr:hypothetical protein [Patescibacteria group bacterium]
MKDILDDPVNYQVSFLDMINSIKCKLNKIKNLTNFSDTCE